MPRTTGAFMTHNRRVMTRHETPGLPRNLSGMAQSEFQVDPTGSGEPGLLREFFEDLEKKRPELWKLCYPRIYTEPRCGRYYTPKDPARQIAQIRIKVENNFYGPAEKYEFMVASHLVKYQVPIYWIGKDMATAIGKTMVPGDVPWYDMPLPFPACCFMWPKGSLVHPTDGDVSFTAYGRFQKGEEYTSPLRPWEAYISGNGCMTVLAYTARVGDKGGFLYHWNIPLDHYGTTINIPDLDVDDIDVPEYRHESGFTKWDMTTEDDKLMIRAVQHTFGAIMAMQARPELITPAKLIKKVERRGEHKEFWSPNVLGERYTIRHAPAGGTHASPRFHWVKGTYRDQPYGPKLQLRKTIWIEPYTRGA